MRAYIEWRDFELEMKKQPPTFLKEHLMWTLMTDGWCSKEGIEIEDKNGKCYRDAFIATLDSFCMGLMSESFIEKYNLERR